MSRRRQLVGLALLASAAAGCDAATAARERQAAAEAASTRPAAGASSPATPPPPSAPAPGAIAAPRAVPGATRVVGIPEGTPKIDARGILEATFDDVKFEMAKADLFQRSMLTPKAESLLDKRIRLRGYMYPTLRKKGLKQFVLVRDNLECCFGPGAALYDCVLVTMEPGKTAEYSIRPIAVAGEFRLEEVPGPQGRPLAIYQMTAEEVE